MIIDKPPLPGDEVEVPVEDLPPSYDALEDLPPRPLPLNEKAGPSNYHPPSLPPNSPQSPKDPSASTSTPAPSPSGKLGWFSFGPSNRAVKEVRATLLMLLRDLVKHGDPHAARGVLDSCADACKTYDLSLSALLQEPALEGHTPLYWAIINRPTHGGGGGGGAPPPAAAEADSPDLITLLLARAAPLTDATVDELRLACLHACDHALFQRLRRTPAFAPLTGKEEIITGGTVPVDDVDVADVPEDEGAFIARMHIPLFQKRMRISEAINLEFIAKGRLWQLSFLVVGHHDRRLMRYGHGHIKPGSWVLCISLLSNSPPSWLDARVVVEDPRGRTAAPPRDSADCPDPGSPSASTSASAPAPASPASPASAGPPTSLFDAVAAMSRGDPRGKLRPPIEVPLRAHTQLSAPRGRRDGHAPAVVVALEENALANSLQFKGCPYLEPDGALVARLDARLVQPSNAECVIC